MSSFPLTWLSCKICAIFGCVGICPGDVWGGGEGCVCLCHMLSFHYIPIQRTWLDLYDFPFNSIPFIDSKIAAKMIFRIENFQILFVLSMRLFVPLKKLSDFTLMIFCIINFQILSGLKRKPRWFGFRVWGWLVSWCSLTYWSITRSIFFSRTDGRMNTWTGPR